MYLLHTSFLCIISMNFNSLVSVRNRSICFLLVPVWILYCHFFSNLFMTSKDFPMDDIFEGSKEVEMVGSSIWALWWVGETVQPSSVIAFVFSNVCDHALSCWRISATFLWDETLLKCFCKAWKVWMWKSELMDWPHGIVSTKTTPCASQKQWSSLSVLKG